MTKAVLFSAENIKKAKATVLPLARAFLQVEPNNAMVLPDTKQGMAIVDQAFAKLEAMGYSPEDSQLLMSEVVDKLLDGGPIDFYIPVDDRPFSPTIPPKKNDF